MKNLKLFVIAIISLLLPSCSNTPSPSIENNSSINGEAEKLSDISYEPNVDNSNSDSKTDIDNSIVNDNSGEISKNPGIAKSINVTENSKEAEREAFINAKYPNNELLGSYSSKVYTKTEDRQKNLRIVCEKLSGTVLAPNQEFSYNETCGPYNKENGFGKATVFLGDGSETQDYGGGVCQLSSTLYNAVKNLNIDVTERHNHSKKVYYVPDGEDATVSYGNLDFKFKNLNDFSLLIDASSSAESVEVNVYKI